MALTDCGGGKFGDHFRVARATAGCTTPEVAVRRGREMIRNTPTENWRERHLSCL